jgi:hypothetical protein
MLGVRDRRRFPTNRWGKRNNGVPTNTELQEAGLHRIKARRQDVINDWGPPRPPLDPNRDLSPDREDGLYIAPRKRDRGLAPPPRRPVFSVPSSKGSIPVTVGAMPPTSPSSRRGYGLRALRY